MGGLVMQPQGKLGDDALGDVRSPIDFVVLTEERKFVGGSSRDVADATC